MARKEDIEVPHGSSEGKIPVKAQTAAVHCIPVLVVIPVTSQVAGTFSYTAPYKLRVLDVWAVHEGGAGEASDTLTVGNAGSAITDSFDWSGADNVIVRATTIDDANRDVAKGGTIRVTTVDNDAGNDFGLATVYVLCAKVP